MVPLGVEVVEERQTEGRRLAGASLGQTNEIAFALQQQGYRLCLDVSGCLKTHLGDGFQQGGGEPKGVKSVQKEENQGAKVAHSKQMGLKGFIHRGERSNFGEVGAGARTGKVAWTFRKDAS